MVTNSMEQTYKDALRHLLQEKLKPDSAASTYEESLFRSVGYLNKLLPFNQRGSLTQAPMISSRKEISEVSEKSMIIESFQQFGQEKLEANNLQPLSVPGAEIHFKNPPESSLVQHLNLDVWSLTQLQTKISDIINPENLHARYEQVIPEKVKVLFVAESFIDPNQEELQPSLAAFQYLFELQTAQLFSNMVKAMRLNKSEYLLTAVTIQAEQEQKSCHEIVMQEIYHFRPSLIITLGITATYALVDTKKRLKDIHGKFFKLSINDFETEVMPLFSPNILKDAIQMKKIAWEDMQKAMDFLKL
jgi:uracil-DNA glycosylase family 4